MSESRVIIQVHINTESVYNETKVTFKLGSFSFSTWTAYETYEANMRDEWIELKDSIGNKRKYISLHHKWNIECTGNEIRFYAKSSDRYDDIEISYSCYDLDRFKELIQEIIDKGDSKDLWRFVGY